MAYSLEIAEEIVTSHGYYILLSIDLLISYHLLTTASSHKL